MVALADQKRRIPQEELSAEILDREYRRAVINKRMVNGKPEYFLGGFPRRIDSCLRSERKLWDSLPEAARDAYIHFMQDYDIWVFPELKAGTWEKSRIVPIEVVLEELDATDDLIWLQDCDCRIYSKVRCEYPIDTCVHWGPSVLNTAYDRGYAVQLTKEEARANLIRSDEAGLIHCFNPGGGLCNCCVCCCWAFKSLHRLEENGYDAKKDFYDVPYIISLDAEKCVNCGLCTKKCQFGALKKGKTHIELDESACFGCGVCRVACRKDALVIKKRESK